MGMACAVVATYIFALEPIASGTGGLLRYVFVWSIVFASALTALLFIFWAVVDLILFKPSHQERFLTLIIALLGFLTFEALRRLAQNENKDNYLSAFLTVIIGIVITLAIEAWPKEKQQAP
jgi:uncharacterized protein involved in response to NO